MTGPTKVRDSVSAITFPAVATWLNITSIPGVVGDGVTDCTTLLNAAAAASDGTPWYVPPGDFLISSGTLLLKAGLVIHGAGKTLSRFINTDYATSGGPVIDTGTGAGIELYSLGIEFTGAASILSTSLQMPLKVRCSEGFILRDCKIEVIDRAAFAVGVNSWYSPLSGAPAISNYDISDNIVIASDEGIFLNSCTQNSYLSNNQCFVSSASSTHSIYASICTNLTVTDNFCEDSIILSVCTSSAVSGNSVKFTQTPADSCIRIAGASSKITVSDNALDSGVNYAAGAGGINITGSVITVTGNTINCAVVDNVIKCTATDSVISYNSLNCNSLSVNGILSIGGHRTIISGNVLTSPDASGIVVSTAANCIVSDNVIYNPNAGNHANITVIEIGTCTYTGVNGNTISTGGGPAPSWAIKFIGTASATNIATSNVVSGYTVVANSATAANNV